jgi:hypothetical protein
MWVFGRQHKAWVLYAQAQLLARPSNTPFKGLLGNPTHHMGFNPPPPATTHLCVQCLHDCACLRLEWVSDGECCHYIAVDAHQHTRARLGLMTRHERLSLNTWGKKGVHVEVVGECKDTCSDKYFRSSVGSRTRHQ